jgi:hypothetical protein
MDKKLYRVKVLLYVMAENESDACMAATNAAFDIFECTARKADHIEPGWENAIPYNSEDYRTCAEVLASQLQVIHRATPFLVDTSRQATRIRLNTSVPSMNH